jgi:hypothetical protein
VRRGALVKLRQGLYYCPKSSRFGVVPPSDDEVLQALFGGAPYVITGLERWNTLGLGTTALSTDRLVYNTKRTGTLEVGGRRYRLRRVAFPVDPPAEWYVVDLLQHTDEAGVSRATVATALRRALKEGRFDADRLSLMAARFGTEEVRATVEATRVRR